jgi:uncharacterized membrane protein YfcA
MNHELVLILAAMSFAFLVKGIAGFGGPLLAIPILAPSLGVEHAVVAVALGNVVSNLMMVWEYRVGWNDTRQILVRLLAAGAAGTVLGTWLLTRLDNRPLALSVAAMVIAYVLISIRKPDFRIEPAQGLRLAWPVGAVGGLVHGATANSGPVFGTFVHSLGLARSSFVFAVTIPFLVFGSIQVATLFGLGAFEGDRLSQSLLAILPVLVVIPLGTRIARRLDQRTFGRIVLGLLVVAAARMVLTAVGI